MELPVVPEKRKEAGRHRSGSRMAASVAASFLLGALAGGFGLTGFCPLVFPMVLVPGLFSALAALMGLTAAMALGFGDGGLWAAALGLVLFGVRWACWPALRLRKSPVFAVVLALAAPVVLLFLFYTGEQRTAVRVLLVLLQGVLGAGLTLMALRLRKAMTRVRPFPLVGADRGAWIILSVLFAAGLTAAMIGSISVGAVLLAAALLPLAHRRGLAAGSMAGIFCLAAVLLSALPGRTGGNEMTLQTMALAITFPMAGMLGGVLRGLPRPLTAVSWLGIYVLAGALFDLPLTDLIPGVCALCAGGLIGSFLPERLLDQLLSPFFGMDADISCATDSKQEAQISEKINPNEAKDMIVRLQRAAGLFHRFAAQGKDVSRRLAVLEEPQKPTGEGLMTACEPVCRTCKNKLRCWQDGYGDTLDCFDHAACALKQHGITAEDFPMYFHGSCGRLDRLCNLGNQYYRAWLSHLEDKSTVGTDVAVYAWNDRNLTDLTAQPETFPPDATVLYDTYETMARLLEETAGQVGKGAKAVAGQADFRYRVQMGAASLAAGPEHLGDVVRLCDTPQGCALLLADGMGTGGFAAVDAAMFTAQLSGALEAGLSVPTALRLCARNLQVKSLREGTVAADVGLINLSDGTLQMHKAGSPPTLICHDGECRVSSADSMPLGVVPSWQLPTGEPATLTDQLTAGDRVLFMSDGLLEPESAVCDRLKELKMLLSNPHQSVQQIADEMVQLARAAGSRDDLTVAVLEISALS